MNSESGSDQRGVALLAETPRRFESELAILGEPGFGRRPTPDEWSPLEVLRHVRASGLVVSSRIWSSLTGTQGVHPSLDERKYGDLLARVGLSAADQIRVFVLRRREPIDLLWRLSDDEWMVTVRTDLGEAPISRVTVEMASHENEHLDQLARAAAVNATSGQPVRGPFVTGR
jgi:hypothetical protein